MAQSEFDSLLVMPGSTAAFRREALIQAGGWTDNIFGEDGEVTNKVARYGYRGVYEPKSIVYSEHPETLRGVLQQRARWGVAFYHSRGRNWRLAREFHTPRSLFFLWDLMTHGAVFGRNLLVPLMAALLIISALDLITNTLSISSCLRLHDTLAHHCKTCSNPCFLDHFAAWIVRISLKSGKPSICSDILAYYATNVYDYYSYSKATNSQRSAFMV